MNREDALAHTKRLVGFAEQGQEVRAAELFTESVDAELHGLVMSILCEMAACRTADIDGACVERVGPLVALGRAPTARDRWVADLITASVGTSEEWSSAYYAIPQDQFGAYTWALVQTVVESIHGAPYDLVAHY